jgi:hypothetical protein
MSPSRVTHANRTVWVPFWNVLTAVPVTVAPLATASTSVVLRAH